jgi:hypothetical protein
VGASGRGAADAVVHSSAEEAVPCALRAAAGRRRRQERGTRRVALAASARASPPGAECPPLGGASGAGACAAAACLVGEERGEPADGEERGGAAEVVVVVEAALAVPEHPVRTLSAWQWVEPAVWGAWLAEPAACSLAASVQRAPLARLLGPAAEGAGRTWQGDHDM